MDEISKTLIKDFDNVHVFKICFGFEFKYKNILVHTDTGNFYRDNFLVINNDKIDLNWIENLKLSRTIKKMIKLWRKKKIKEFIQN